MWNEQVKAFALALYTSQLLVRSQSFRKRAKDGRWRKERQELWNRKRPDSVSETSRLQDEEAVTSLPLGYAQPSCAMTVGVAFGVAIIWPSTPTTFHSHTARRVRGYVGCGGVGGRLGELSSACCSNNNTEEGSFMLGCYTRRHLTGILSGPQVVLDISPQHLDNRRLCPDCRFRCDVTGDSVVPAAATHDSEWASSGLGNTLLLF